MNIENEVENDILNYTVDNSYTDDINLFHGIKESLRESNRSPFELLEIAFSYA